ncbi:MAG: efflux RND transporter periplasmic adaptor subunit [Deltaproteobacteria bacterium]|nr:efflux RND transporter periplasmic adaptor subunit [Deltaproteobacteria bacterium]MCW5804264.1 efflux RND transporter periplasmic adaptor subunit [Deltaproteobacteria bacterium]
MKTRALRLAIIVGAAMSGGTAIVLARHYKRPDPPAQTPAPGMTVGSNSITLTSDAAMWSAIRIAPAEAAKPHWTDPVPARIVFDEARASRLGSPLVGRVTAVLVERGQRVAEGDKLFSVSSPNLAELRGEYEKAVVVRDAARINLERVKALVEAGSVPAKELTAAQQQQTEGDLAVRLASQKLASLKVSGAGESTFTMVAPRAGVVVEKNVAVGQNVDPSAGFAIAIADLDSVWVVADLFEGDVGALPVGTKARVTVNRKELECTVDQISAVVDPERHTIPVRMRLPNTDGTLRPNSYAEVSFFDDAVAYASVPSSAVLSDGASSYVYKKTSANALVKHPIVTGPVRGGFVPVLSGLAAGDLVVVQGGILLDNQIQLDN